MFRSILVPLDGSAFAEQALPLATDVACKAGAALNLVRVHMLYALTEPACAWLPFYPSADAALKQQEQAYLGAVSQRLTCPKKPIASCLAVGMEADAILEQAQASKVDLIVMTTHGRGPASRFFLGSVADEVVRRAPVPVVLLRPHDPPEEPAAPPSITKVLVPLDGSALAEEVLGPAATLARLLGARCTLLRVVESRLHPPAAPHAGELPPDPRVGEARSYLRGVGEKLNGQSIRSDVQVVVSPHSAGAILEAAQTEPGTLIALATHGHGGFRRMLLGSVADKLIRAAAGPVLVYRPTTPA